MNKTRRRKKRTYLAFLPVMICGIATVIYACLFVLTDDNKAPQITMDTPVLEVSVEADEKALLQEVINQVKAAE